MTKRPGSHSSVDYSVLARLEDFVSRERCSVFLGMCIDETLNFCNHLEERERSNKDLAKRAHRLKGLSSTLGLIKISRLAEVIEKESSESMVFADFSEALRSVVAETQAELGADGWLNGSGEGGSQCFGRT